MTTLGVIGSGRIGSTVARLAIAAGHEAALSNSRGPQTLLDLVAELGAAELLDSIGYGTVDGGALANGWRQLSGTPVYGTPYGTFDNEKGTPAGADVIRAALAAATR